MKPGEGFVAAGRRCLVPVPIPEWDWGLRDACRRRGAHMGQVAHFAAPQRSPFSVVVTDPRAPGAAESCSLRRPSARLLTF